MKNILWIVCISLTWMLAAPIDAQQQASQKPARDTRMSQNQTELGKLIGIVEQMDKRLDRVENRLDRVEDRQDALNKKMDAKFDEQNKKMDAKFDEQNKKMDAQFDEKNKKMDAQFEQLHNRMNTMFYWFMGIISALVAPIAITLGYDTYRRLRNGPSPQVQAPSPQTVGDQQSAKQATGG